VRDDRVDVDRALARRHDHGCPARPAR
jgi:hypothetical protein